MEEFLRGLGITEKGSTTEDGSYVIDIPDSNTYGKYLSKLDRSTEVEEDTESSQVTEDVGSIQYVNDDFTITLLSDFDQDTYKLTIREN